MDRETVVQNLLSEVNSGEITLDDLKCTQTLYNRLVRAGLTGGDGGIDRVEFVACLNEVISQVEAAKQ